MSSEKKSTSQAILELVNPVPTSFDPEENDTTGGEAKLVENYDEEFSDEDNVISSFRKKLDLLEEDDVRYSGRKVSRKSLGIEDASLKSDSDEDHADSEEYEDANSNIGLDSEVSEDEVNERESENGTTDEDDSIADDDSYSIGKEVPEEENSQEYLSGVADDSFQHVSSKNKNLETEKGTCIRNQLKMWDSVLECRIHLQKLLMAANRLPKYTDFEEYQVRAGSEFRKMMNKNRKMTTDLLEKLILLRERLINSFPETRSLKYSKKGENVFSAQSDEDIPSSTDESFDEEQSEPPLKKRKLEDYATLLDSQHSAYLEYRNSTIQKWNDKTRVSSGRISSRNFSSFEHSTLKQIEQIMSNRPRLIQRTQLKRTNYAVLGQNTVETQDDSEPVNSELSHEDKSVSEYDQELFDDSDFYHKLLQELIEHKAADITDPVRLGRQWIELQKLRSKMKRKVDVRATKGRKIRYVVHQKLVNFMAPITHTTWTDEAKTELYNSLFGKKKV